MPGLSLIAGYLDTLSGQLPRPVVEELADGLEETYRRHLSLGLTPDEAESALKASANNYVTTDGTTAVTLSGDAQWLRGA